MSYSHLFKFDQEPKPAERKEKKQTDLNKQEALFVISQHLFITIYDSM